MSVTVPIKATALPLWVKLQTAVVEATGVPCCGAHSSLWTSELAEDREAAAYRCTGCPVIKACRDYATAAKEKFGVWAACDRTPGKGRHVTPPIPMFDTAECEPNGALTLPVNASNAI